MWGWRGEEKSRRPPAETPSSPVLGGQTSVGKGDAADSRRPLAVHRRSHRYRRIDMHRCRLACACACSGEGAPWGGTADAQLSGTPSRGCLGLCVVGEPVGAPVAVHECGYARVRHTGSHWPHSIRCLSHAVGGVPYRCGLSAAVVSTVETVAPLALGCDFAGVGNAAVHVALMRSWGSRGLRLSELTSGETG